MQRNSPRAQVENDRQRIDDLARRVATRARQLIELRRETLAGATRQLAALNPDATLERGYAIVRAKTSGRVVKRVSQVKRGEGIAIGRELVTTLMRRMGIEALYCRPNTS